MTKIREDGRPVGRPFEKGQGGRPKGARNKLSEAFIEALFVDFQANGVAAIEVVRTEKPDQYLKVIASILPRDVNVTTNPLDEMSDAELTARIRDLAAVVAPYLDADDADQTLAH